VEAWSRSLRRCGAATMHQPGGSNAAAALHTLFRPPRFCTLRGANYPRADKARTRPAPSACGSDPRDAAVVKCCSARLGRDRHLRSADADVSGYDHDGRQQLSLGSSGGALPIVGQRRQTPRHPDRARPRETADGQRPPQCELRPVSPLARGERGRGGRRGRAARRPAACLVRRMLVEPPCADVDGMGIGNVAGGPPASARHPQRHRT